MLKKIISIILIISTALAMLCNATVKENDGITNSAQEAFREEKVFPDIISKSEIKEKGYVGREKELEENLNTVVLKNSDGTYTLRLFDFPVKYVDDNGDIKDISLALSKENDGSFRSKYHKIDVRLSNEISDGISLEYENVDIKLKPEVDKKIQAEQKDEKTINYEIDEKTSYEYSLTYDGFKEDIVVNEYSGQTDYDFVLETNGLAIKKIQDSYYLVDSDEIIRATIGDIIIFTADERNNSLGEIIVKTIEDHEKYQLTIHIDKAYLQDEKTEYPIRIDPTISIVYNNSNDDGRIEDVTINSLDTSNGYSGSLFVGKRQTYGISRVLMKFPGLDLPSVISDSSQILDAEVEMRDLLCETIQMYIYAHRFTGNVWSENDPTVGWSTVDSNNYILSYLDCQTVSYSNGYNLNPRHRYSFNITEAVQMWYNSPYDKNKGIIFRAEDIIENSTSTYINRTFASYNRTENKPSLSVKFTAIIPKRVYKIRNVFLYQYLTAVDKDTLKTSSLVVDENGNAKDGKQLWYADADASGITLYSMGIKDLDSYGANEMVLGGYLNNYSPKIKPEGSSATKWELELTFFNNNYYNVKNIAADNYMVGTSANGTVTSSTTTTVYSYWVFEEIERSTFNNYLMGTCKKSGNKLYVKVNLDSSVSDITSLTLNDFELVKLWNNISSKVIIYGPNDTPPSGVTTYNITIYATYIPGTPYSITYGETMGYKYDETFGEIPAYLYEDWYSSSITLNSNSIISGDTLKASLVHEMGHALKLQHPKDSLYIVTFVGARGAYADDNCVVANMNQKDVTSSTNLKCSSPKIHDKINLINKWGG